MIGARTLSRYLLRETAAAWAAVLAVLLLVMLASRSVRFLTAAAEGSIPPDLVAQVVLLSGMQYLMLITPISLLLGVMLAMGRLYKDQEITAATACGVGLGRLAQPFVVLAVIAALFTAMLSLDLGPRAGRAVDQLTQEAREQLSYAPFESGRFSSMAGGDAVFYAERARDAYALAWLMEHGCSQSAIAEFGQSRLSNHLRELLSEALGEVRLAEHEGLKLGWVVLDTGRGYPAWLPDGTGTTPGTLIELREPVAAFPAMDAYEGPDYQRVRTVLTDGTVAWAYAWRSPTDGFRPGWAAAVSRSPRR